MILVTGAAGFIGSCLVSRLNDSGFSDLILVDEFNTESKLLNLESKLFAKRIDRSDFIEKIKADYHFAIHFVFHLGARTDTTEKNQAIFNELNLEYSKSLWKYCGKHNIPFIYASSAATYGNGSLGYNDSHDLVNQLVPLNPYGKSKNDFDKWVLNQSTSPPFWAGLRFFNVYGPNEFHKGRMASVIYHTFNQIKATGKMKLFRSHRPEIANGHQSRDFIYVKDVIDLCLWFMKNQDQPSGIYNVGTGTARTFNDLAELTFKAMGEKVDITYIDTPQDIRGNYQYFTEAKMDKLLSTGFKREFYSLEQGISDYVKNYLLAGKYF